MERKQNQTSFHGTYLNLTAYLFYQNILKYFNDFQNRNFWILWLKVNPDNGNETKSGIFPMHIFKSDIIFIGCKILKYFNDFYNWNWHFSISLQKWAWSRETKSYGTCANLTVLFYLRSSTLLKWPLKFISL